MFEQINAVSKYTNRTHYKATLVPTHHQYFLYQNHQTHQQLHHYLHPFRRQAQTLHHLLNPAVQAAVLHLFLQPTLQISWAVQVPKF